MWRAALLGLAAVVLLAACGGGGDADGLVTIHRLGLEDAELNPVHILNPPPENDYPGVVATVNRIAITGNDLASRQVVLELSRREREDLADSFPEELDKIASTDPLEELIDEELERQAAESLGLLPTYEEGVGAAREEQRSSESIIAGAPPEQRQVMRQTLEQLGAPSGDWGSDREWVDRVRQEWGLARLRNEFCEQAPTPTQSPSILVVQNVGRDCTDFLRRERQGADIVYYVRWAE